MTHLRTLIGREFAAYFATPLAYVFLLVFLVLASALPLYMGGFYENEQADLQAFFAFHPGCICFCYQLWACAYGRKNAKAAASNY